MKILITGTNGMLGKDIVSVMKKNESNEVFGLNRNIDNALEEGHSIECDMTNSHALLKALESVNPNVVIHTAANVNVEMCENNKDLAFSQNVKATQVIADYCKERAKLIFISTDSVFEGNKGNYSEKDITNPGNYYAQTKVLAEKYVFQLENLGLVLRTNIYGFHKKKGHSLVEWALNELYNQRSINGFTDVYFNPVYTKQLALVISECINEEVSGLMHIGSEDSISKYDFLLKIAEVFNISGDMIRPISIDSLKFSAKRPKNSTLDIRKMNQTLKRKISLDEGIEELAEDYIQNYGERL